MKLIANWTIRRDGERLAPGTAFESDDAGLVACGAARLADADDGAVVDGSPPTDGGPAAPTDRAARIRQALHDMLSEDPRQDNDILWTRYGRPRNSAVCAARSRMT